MKRILGLAVLAAIALTGLTACMGDDDDGSALDRRRSAALVNTGSGQNSTGELTIAGLTGTGQAIDVDSYSWGIENPGTAPQVDALVITKTVDEESPDLFKGAANGTVFASAVLKANRSFEASLQNYLTYELTNVQVVSVKQSGQLGGNQIPVEQVALKYATVKQSFTAFAANGTKGATTTYSYAVK